MLNKCIKIRLNDFSGSADIKRLIAKAFISKTSILNYHTSGWMTQPLPKQLDKKPDCPDP